jgi:hypothetical protein
MLNAGTLRSKIGSTKYPIVRSDQKGRVIPVNVGG